MSSKHISQEFFISSTKEFECAICLEVLDDPVLTRCGHNFCSSCIKASKSKSCSLCNHNLGDLDIFPDKRTERLIFSLTMKCTNRCEWQGIFSELAKHLSTTCPNEELLCTLKCGNKFKRRDLSTHEKNSCPKRTVQCTYCPSTFQYEILSQHLNKCEHHPVKCNYGCTDKLRRMDLKSHENNCLEKAIKCPFADTGCEWSLARKDLEKHIRDNQILHMNGLLREFILLKDAHQNLIIDHETVKKKNTELEKMIECLGTILFFSRVSDFDKNGILYWIGTNRGSQEYINPMVRGMVNVSISGKGCSCVPADFIEWNDLGRFVITSGISGSWVQIECKGFSVSPTQYTVRGGYTGHDMRNWSFDGSNDGKIWVTLRNHSNDTTINSRNTGSWTVERKNYFSFFRLITNGKNRSNCDGYLAIAGFEFYGSVFEKK